MLSYVDASIKFSIHLCIQRNQFYSQLRKCFCNCPPSCIKIKQLLSEDYCFDSDQRNIVGRRNLPCEGSYNPCQKRLCTQKIDFINLHQEIIWSFRANSDMNFNLTFLKFNVGREILRVDKVDYNKLLPSNIDLRATDKYVLIVS